MSTRVDEKRLCAAVEDLDPASRALLELSLGRGMSDGDLVEVLGGESGGVAARRSEVIERIADDLGVRGDPAAVRALREDLRGALARAGPTRGQGGAGPLPRAAEDSGPRRSLASPSAELEHGKLRRGGPAALAGPRPGRCLGSGGSGGGRRRRRGRGGRGRRPCERDRAASLGARAADATAPEGRALRPADERPLARGCGGSRRARARGGGHRPPQPWRRRVRARPARRRAGVWPRSLRRAQPRAPLGPSAGVRRSAPPPARARPGLRSPRRASRSR